MIDCPTPPLSEELCEIVRTRYPLKDQEEVRTALLRYGTARWEGGCDRVRFDVLQLAAGDIESVRKTIDLAKSDPRDVMSQEYFWRTGHKYPHDWARRHEINRDHPKAPELDPATIAVTNVIFQRRYNPRRRVRMDAVLSRISRYPRALFLLFDDAEKLREFAGIVLTLSDEIRTLNLSPFLEYRWDPSPPRTILRRRRLGSAGTLTDKLGAVRWSGGRQYWRECSRQLLELAGSKVASQLWMMRNISDRQVVIAIRPTGTSAPDTRALLFQRSLGISWPFPP